MSTETLEDEKPHPDQDGAAKEAQPKNDDNKPTKEASEITPQVASVEKFGNAEPEEKKVNGKGKESDRVEKKEEDAEHDESEGEVEHDDGKVQQSDSKKSKEVATPVTATERPTRERKSVERYTVSSPAKFPRSNSSKPLSIEKGHGTLLKDIPNVAFKLSKRKPDDNLRTLHNILFGKKAKAHNLKRNIGLFSGYVWAENEEKQRARVKERIEKCVKEKLVDFCDVLNIPINKTGLKKEELSAKLLEFLESPHATTEVLLADKEKKGKKRAKKATPSKSAEEVFETPAKKQKQTSQVGKKRKQSSDIEEDDTAEPSDAKDDSQEDGEDVSIPRSESDHEESKSEEEEDKQKVQKRTSKKTVEDQTTSVKKAPKSNEKTPKRSTSKKTVADSSSASLSKSKQSASKKQKSVRENQDNKGKVANKKQSDKSSKALVKNQGKGKSSKKEKAEPSREEIHSVVSDILKEVDFNTATLSDILRLLGTHFGLDLMHRKSEVKDIITDVINNMSDEEDGEDAENDGDNGTDKDDA